MSYDVFDVRIDESLGCLCKFIDHEGEQAVYDTLEAIRYKNDQYAFLGEATQKWFKNCEVLETEELKEFALEEYEEEQNFNFAKACGKFCRFLQPEDNPTADYIIDMLEDIKISGDKTFYKGRYSQKWFESCEPLSINTLIFLRCPDMEFCECC
ncbi:hypothetical protein [Desulfovibrio litoralis]|uniref:Uncharacterized protein n=1 Tax=Desulfovibrio litoralis DSM 11393 TaxID=1121455 RepID=A0A1M7T7M8_9BACT|nr:hypothetical protein [Desulfovibrio litoralis]SHN66694.1 hypothetical protein SAMN02745728_01677 [Desulfovibrio litoralis DSM 11393]